MIELIDVCKTFDSASGEVEAVKNVNLTIEDGDIYGIIGLSGAGKSTLVRCINFLEVPTSGKVIFDGVDLSTLNHKELLATRKSMSMIFQGFNLLAQRTSLKNICYPMEISGVPVKEAKKKALELLKIVGLENKANAYPSQLSGGQKQRIAIARALASNPKVLLCDEATSALDPTTTASILELLKRINREMGVTIVVITHEMKVVEQICNKVAVLSNGVVVEKGLVKDIFIAPKSEAAKELVLPKSAAVDYIDGKQLVRIVFDGNSSFEPVISNLSLECHTAVNILGANTQNIDGKAYGQMLLQLPDDEAAVIRIKNYLDSRNIRYEEEFLNA